MAAEVEHGLYVVGEGVPWHRLGEAEREFWSLDDIRGDKRFDYQVAKVPLYAKLPDGSLVEVEDNFGVQRDSDGKVLGVVGDRYEVAQNIEVARIMDEAVGAGQAIYDTVWSLRGGRTFAITAKLANAAGGTLPNGESIDFYITATTTHDGSGKIRYIYTPIRVVCMNTLTMATNAAVYRYERKHTAQWNSEDRIAECREALSLGQQYASWVTQTANELVAEAFNKKSFEKLAVELFVADYADKKVDDWTHQETAKFEQLMAVRANSKNLANIKNTKWGALNAVAEYVDYGMDYRSTKNDTDEKRVESLLYGRGVDIKTHALELLRAA
jgi:phage/plasmid-like protein (TIGR03299 family)